MLKSFFLAVQFLTRVPVPGIAVITCEHSGRSVLFYPLIGALLGFVLLVFAATISSVWLAAALVLLIWVVMTGALHLDGLADTADAWVGGHGDAVRMLKIMHDPYSGPVGVTAIVVVLLVKFAALVELISAQSFSALVWAPVLGRSGILFFVLSRSSAQTEGLAADLVACLPRRAASWVLVTIALLCLILGNAWLVVVVLGMWLAMGFVMQQRVGGYTGDILGASVEITEAVCLCILVITLPV